MSAPDQAVLDQARGRFADLNHVPIGLAVLDPDLRVLFWNDTMANVTGITVDRALGVPLATLNPVWSKPHYRGRLSHLFEGGPPVVFSPLLHPNIVPHIGAGRSFHVKATAVPGGGTDAWWAFLSVEDVTILSRRVEELRELRTQQERMMREIHHRVKNNLNMISGLITLQKSQPDSEPAHTALDDLQSRIVAISEIHDILYHSTSLSAGNTSEYLETLARLLDRNLSYSEGHRLTLQFDRSITLKTDMTVLLGLIQAELMTNALKYGLGRVAGEEICISLVRLGGRDLEYSLSHSGDRLPGDFDPTTSTGLGMVLLSAYAGQLGSRLEWEKGDPTRFWLRFTE